MKDTKVLSIPNIITFIRIVLIPAFVTVLIYKMYNYALTLFIIAGLSDALDGLLARATGQKTKLGAFLDPLADKFLLLTSFILFSVYDWIPKWLVITVISRDLIVTLGWFLVYLTSHNMRVQPTITGKAAITSQFILIAYILLSINFDSIPSPGNWMFLTVAALTIASGLHYIHRGLKHTDDD